MTRVSRGQHAHQTALANDPTKDISANQWNDTTSPAHVETGIFGLPTSTSFVALSSNQLIPVDTFTVVKASSGTSDTLNFIATNIDNANDIFFLAPFSGHTITVANNVASPPTNYGAIVLLSGANKVLDANVPTVLIRIGSTFYEYALNAGITNANISSSAAIVYGKLNLTGSILNADIANSAAIAYSKLNLAGSIANGDLAGSISPSKITGTAAILGANTFTGAQTVTNIINSVTVLTPSGSVAVDFSATDDVCTLANGATASLTITASNYAAGDTRTIIISNGSTAVTTLTLPAWVFVGGSAPTTIAANKTLVITVTSTGTTAGACVAATAVQS